MIVNKAINGNALTLFLEGRLDSTSSPEVEALLEESLDGMTELVFDFEKLECISSAGMRILLVARKKMNKQGTMKVVHVGEMIMEVFDETGFSDILTVE